VRASSPAERSSPRAAARRSALSPVIIRSRLVQELNRVLEARAFFVVAPAGFGKTTLITQSLTQLDALAVLIPLGDRDRDDAAFLCSTIIERFRAARANFGAHTSTAMRAGLDAHGLAHALAADLLALQEPVVAAFDDVHLLLDPAASAATEKVDSAPHAPSPGMVLIAELLRNDALDDIHLLIASRLTPPLRYSRLTLRGLTAGLGKEDLAFSTDEVRTYLERQSGRPVALAEARALREATEGWPAGVALALAETRRGGEPKPFRRDQAFDYLEQEVMPSLPDGLREFAIAASALGDLSAELCDYALNRTDSFDCLRELERRNLFIQRLPGRDRVFRLHATFRELLHNRYLDPAHERAVQLKAAQFWTVNQRWLEVLAYLQQATAWSELKAIVDQRGRSLLDQGYASTVRQTLDTLSEHEALPQGLTLLHAETLIRASEVAAATMLMDDVTSSDPAIQAGLSVLQARAARIGARNDEAVRIAEEELTKARCTNDQEAYLHRYAGLGHLFLDRYDEAEAHHVKALERFEASGNLAEAAYTRCDLGLTHFFRGVDYLKAERYYRQALKLVRRLHRSDTLAMVLNNLASLLIVTARSREALEMLHEARIVVEETGDLFWQADVAHSFGEAYRNLGEQEAALEAFEESSIAAWEANAEFRGQSACLWRAIVLAETGRDAEVAPLLDLVRGNLMTRLRPLDLLVDLRRAWLRHDLPATRKLASKLILVSRDARQERYVRFGRLFLAAAMVQKGEPDGEFATVLHGLASNAVQAQDAFISWPDAGEVVLANIGDQASTIEHYRSWRATLERLSADRVFRPAIAAAARRPDQIEIFALRPAIVVHIDGQPKTSWRRQGALEALLYLVHHKSGGQDMAAALIEAPHAGDSDELLSDRGDVTRKFHQLLATLKQALGRDAIQSVGDQWPRRYQLDPDIKITYDVEQFTSCANTVLGEPPRTEQLDRIRMAKAFRPNSFAATNGRMHEWVVPIYNEIERLWQRLLTRERQLCEELGLPTRAIDAEVRRSMSESGVHLRSA
jgi:ATP/maltotriose-dependent transcriptional regulator MalT